MVPIYVLRKKANNNYSGIGLLLFVTFISTVVMPYGCSNAPHNAVQAAEASTGISYTDTATNDKEYGYEALAIKCGLQNIATLDSSILVRMAYADTNNFTGHDVYGTFTKAYLHPSYAKKLVIAQKALKQSNPNLTLIVYDAARPCTVQQQLWDYAKIPESQKHLYLSKPAMRSLHNYGAAVDVAIADSSGNMLPFGSEYDYFGREAQPQYENELLKKGVLQPEHIANRRLLQKVMHNAGFMGIKTEWWHFNACTRAYAKSHHRLFH